MLRRMILVGLTGGVATGKSTVARLFLDCGAVVIDADLLARMVVEPGKPAWREIVRTFGKTVLLPDRTINRAILGHIVFHNRTKLRQLERIIHPRVAREQARLTKRTAKKESHAVVIYDVPLLFEGGIDKRVNQIIVVTTDRETQIARLQRRNHLSRTDALRRIRSQISLRKKVRQADHVLDGTLPIPRLRHLVQALHMQLRLLA